MRPEHKNVSEVYFKPNLLILSLISQILSLNP